MLHGTKDFSEMENRVLTAYPKLSVEGILSGDVERDFEKAASDQIAGRDIFVKAATAVRYSLGERCIGDVYITKDKNGAARYLEKVTPSDVSKKRLSTNISVMEKVAADHPDLDVKVFFAPTDSVVARQFLPEGAALYNDRFIHDLVALGMSLDDVIYAPDEFSPEEYFATDHHWNTDGAYRGAAQYLKAVKKENALLPQSRYEYLKADDKFFGTLYSKAPTGFCEGEDFKVPVMSYDPVVIIDSKQTKGIYETDYFGKKDKYAAYFGGNFGRVEIINDSAATDDTLLMVKDSFANSAVPYLSNAYKKIVMIDLRYYNGSFSSLLSEESFDELVFFYEMSDFFEDENFSKLLR